MVVSREGNLFALLGSDVEDDPEFILPVKKKKDLKVEKKQVIKAKTEEQLKGLKVPVVDTRAKQSRIGGKPSSAVRSNEKNNLGAPKAQVTQQKNPTNGYNQRHNNNGYTQRNVNGYKGGSRDGNSYYQQRNRGNNGGYRSGAGEARQERKISGEEISGDHQKVVVGQDNDDDNSWCFVGKKGKVSKKGSVSEDLNSTRSESIHEGSEYSSKTLEQHSSVGQPGDQDNQSVQATSDQGDVQVKSTEKWGQCTEELRNTEPKEEQKPENPTFTLKEYETQQAEKRKALEALKRSEERKVEDKELESWKVIGKKGKMKTQSVEEVDKTNTNKERNENKAPKAIRITEFVVPDKDELLIERPDGTWHLVKQRRWDGEERPGRVIRHRRFRKDDQAEKKDGGDEAAAAGNDKQRINSGRRRDAVAVPPLDMDGLVRAKRVSDELAGKFKAHLIDAAELSYGSGGSGSEHSVDGDSDLCLSELVHGFLHGDADDQVRPGESDTERVDSVTDCSQAAETVAACSCRTHADSYRNCIYPHVCAAMEVFSGFSGEKSVYRRKIMLRLRELGYNAAVCKTKWSSSSSGGISSGQYEFIDVVAVHSSQIRYIIDLDFASEFEIARPTGKYTALLQSLPAVFVGRSEELKRIVKAMSDSARRSLKSRDLSVPPWRKNRYMQNKWLGPYRRTASLNTETAAAVNGAKCRHVGFEFDGGVTGRLFVRTR